MSRKFVIIVILCVMKCKGCKVIMLICYDVIFVCLFDHGGVDVLLVGDFLGMVV